MKDATDHQTADFLEDARDGKPIDVAQTLSDGQLEAGGMKPVKAWVRTKQAGNAQRTARYKERQQAEGVKQLNLQAPQEAHEALKEIAARTRAGEPLAEVIDGLSASVVRSQPQSLPAAELAAVVRTLEAGGLRARLIRWLAAGRA